MELKFYELLLSGSLNVLSVYVNMRVLRLFLYRKKERAGIAMPLYFFVWLVNWLAYAILQNYYLTTLSMICGLLLAAWVLYEGTAGKRAAAVAVSAALILTAEEIVWRVMDFTGLEADHEAIGSLCAILLSLSILFLLENKVSLDKSIRLPGISYFYVIFVIAGSIVLTEIFSSAEITNKYIILGTAVIYLLDVTVCFLYERVIESYREKLKATIMEEQVKMYRQQFDMVKQSQRNLQSMRHDMKNHLHRISDYLRNAKYEEAERYIEQMEGRLETAGEYIRTGNVEIDAILNRKLSIAEEAGCKTVIKADIPEQKFMSDFDLTVLLGNLFDNAVEALQKTEEKFLSVEIRYMKGVLYLSVSNSFQGILYRMDGKRNRFLSTKKNPENHGIGLLNIEDIVNRYHGEMRTDSSGGIYRTDIILYVQDSEVWK